jgi:hypothetical protein
MENKYQNSIGIILPKEFIDLVDKILKENTDLKTEMVL